MLFASSHRSKTIEAVTEGTSGDGEDEVNEVIGRGADAEGDKSVLNESNISERTDQGEEEDEVRVGQEN